VRILPRKVIDGQIRCVTYIRRVGPSIERSGLEGGFQYSALSYVWGDPTPRHCIFVDGTARLIAHNLWQFLLDASDDRWFWIDALSIDQMDPEERRHQVGIMSTIFRGALEVIVWLGPQSEHSSILVSLETKPWSAATSNSVVELCERPYWQRLWVFQEIKHARKIMLLSGGHSTSWNYLEALFNGRIKLYTILPSDIARRVNCSPAARMVRLRTKLMDSSVWNLLRESRHLECMDRRDKVYAILSTATEGLKDIEADYCTSLELLGTRVLRNYHTMNPPASMYIVLQDCYFIAEVLGVDAESLCQFDATLPAWMKHAAQVAQRRHASVEHYLDKNLYEGEVFKGRGAIRSWRKLRPKLMAASRTPEDQEVSDNVVDL
jgi:hypothetical protein